MSEGYPQNQEQQFSTQDNEQSSEQPQFKGEDVQVTEPNSVEENGGMDTRWDHDKAETMAAVLKDDGSFDEVIEHRDAVKQKVNSKDYLDRYTEVEKGDLEYSQELASEPADARLPYGSTQADRERQLEKDQNKYDTAVVETHALGERAIEKSRQRVEDKVEEVLSPYQELYDMNPAIFADMPTKEFMVIAKGLAEISDEIEINEDNSNRLEWYNHKLKDAFENKSLVNWGIIDNFRQDICRSLGKENDDTYDRVLEKFEAEASDSFDKTPRQIMEGYTRVGNEYTSQFEAKKLADQQRKKDFLDKHKPETSDKDQN